MTDAVAAAQSDPVAVAAPVAAEPAAAVASPSPALAAAPEAPAAAVEPVAATEAPAAPARTSLIAEAKTGEEPKPAEAAPAEAAPVEGEAPAAEAQPSPEDVKIVEPEPVAYTDFMLPEGVQLESEKVGKYTELLGKHRAPQELGQELINLHLAEVQAVADRVQRHNVEAWDRMQDQWVSDFRSDREIGGNREITTLRNCAAVIEQYGGSPEQQAQLRQVFTATGAGNNPAVIRLLNNIGRVLSEGRPVPAAKPPAQPSSRQERRYGSTKT